MLQFRTSALVHFCNEQFLQGLSSKEGEIGWQVSALPQRIERGFFVHNPILKGLGHEIEMKKF
jgi:hypothetical protein